MMGDLPKEKLMVSLWWVTYPNARWSKCGLVLLSWVTYPNKRWRSHYDGWPIQMKDSGLIMMGDLPRKNDGVIVMGDLPRKVMVSLWWVTYPSGKNDGLIMMGDLPKWKMMVSLWWVTYPEKMMVVSLWWVTYPEKIMMVSLWWVTYPNGRWMSHYDGWPILMKGDGLIMMGDLPK